MTDEKPQQPWVYLATRDRQYHGSILAAAGIEQIKAFYLTFAGCDIRAVFSREEFLKALEETDV